MRLNYRVIWVLLLLAVIAPVGAAAVPLHGGAAPRRERLDAFVTYQVGARGEVDPAAVEALSDVVRDTLNDPRGWGLDGSVHFAEVTRSDELRIWLASPEAVANAADGCGRRYSCRVGADVFINALRWEHGAASHEGQLASYRQYVVNHEVGHWFELDHRRCGGRGRPAPVMQQQSKALRGCTATVWPTDDERQQALVNLRQLDIGQ